MAATPLYKGLKNGTSFYAFASSAEDISAAYQNQNYKMYFSKYILLNLPKINLNPGTNSSPIQWDFNNSAGKGYGFQSSVYSVETSINYSDRLVESLRNYVANQEVTIKESRLNNTEYYYDNNVMATTTEKIFWKWCKQLNLIDFEQANPGDQYFNNLSEFASNSVNDYTYFPEVLWQERQVLPWNTVYFSESSYSGFSGNLVVEFEALTNFRVGDTIQFASFSNSNLAIFEGQRQQIVGIIPAGLTQGQRIITDYDYSGGGSYTETTGTAELVYNRLVQYIGEVNGINNVQEANRSYTEVWAHIPDNTGQTPDILFRTIADTNYKPNMVFPILPSQYQPEIIGAEIFTSPIVSNPSNYPGNYYGQFDTLDFTYTTQTGDSLRRSGEYYGISGDVNAPVLLSNDSTGQSTIDGISVDFDTTHYVKMNIIGQEITNFDQFNAMMVNNQPPTDFEFNAILWYYNVEDISGNVATNLYGISFVDNPSNNPVESEIGLRVPLFTKLAANDYQDGVSYAFSLNLSFNIINDNPQDTYNPQAINSLFSMNLYNQAMTRLSSVNSQFMNIIANQNQVTTDLSNMKQLLYTQTDFDTISAKIKNLESLLKLYSTMQINDSDTITVSVDNTTTPPRLTLNSIDSTYYAIDVALTGNMYNTSGAIPYIVSVPKNKNFLIYIENNDTTAYTLPNSDVLSIVLDQDLGYKQSCDIIIDANTLATQNKRLDIYMMYASTTTATPVETLLLGTLDLPIYYNSVKSTANSASRWSDIKFNIDLNSPFRLNTGGILEVPVQSNGGLVYNSFSKGDTLQLKDFTIGTSSQIDFSGQYTVSSVGLTNSYVYLDVSSKSTLINYGASASLPLVFNNSSSYLLSNMPHFKLNKGVKYKITRVSDTDTAISDRYLIESEIH